MVNCPSSDFVSSVVECLNGMNEVMEMRGCAVVTKESNEEAVLESK